MIFMTFLFIYEENSLIFLYMEDIIMNSKKGVAQLPSRHYGSNPVR